MRNGIWHALGMENRLWTPEPKGIGGENEKNNVCDFSGAEPGFDVVDGAIPIRHEDEDSLQFRSGRAGLPCRGIHRPNRSAAGFGVDSERGCQPEPGAAFSCRPGTADRGGILVAVSPVWESLLPL